MARQTVDSWRDSNNYRSEYFQKNPGLLGCIWFCVYCGKPLMGKHQVEVDHVIPPSAFAHKKYKKGKLVSNTSILARTMNSSFNTAAACPDCNRKKSDKIGLITVRGAVGKTGEVATGAVRKVAAYTLYGAGKVVWGGTKLLTKPFRSKSPVIVKLAFALAYAVIIYYLINR